MVRVANRDCREFVESLTEFKGSNLFSKKESKYYVVYSYGTHFPMVLYVYADDKWFVNTEKRSRSTSRHQNQSYPYNKEVTKVDTEEMFRIMRAINLRR